MNPLDEIMDWYQSAYDAMRLTRRIIHRNADPDAITDKFVFFGLPEQDCDLRLEAAISELQNVVVLVQVAVFERTLRKHVFTCIQNALTAMDPLTTAIRAELEKDAEFWNFSDRLVDVFTMVPATDRGNIKQLIDFRNWLAHGHFTSAPVPTVTDPGRAYDRLSAFLQAANLI